MASGHLYRVLLVAYPPRFRQEYGEAMTQVFRDCCREANRRDGLLGVLRLWLVTLGDTASTALAERITEILPRSREEMTEANKARRRRLGDLLGADFKAAVAQVVDDDERDYEGAAQGVQDDQTAREVRLADEPAVVRIAHTIIALAIRDGASEIQVEAAADGVDVRFRIGSTIHQVMRLPKRVQRKLVARYKHMAEMDVEERGAPQDGRIGITHQGADHDLQVHSEPLENGESVIMSIKTRQ